MNTKTIAKHTLPATSLGNELSPTVIRYGPPYAGNKAYIQAGLHADEAPGFVAMHHLIDKLDRAESDNKIEEQIILISLVQANGEKIFCEAGSIFTVVSISTANIMALRNKLPGK
jgi:predicted deacylase